MEHVKDPMRKTCKNCGLEVEMGDAGVGGGDVASGIDADVGLGLMGLEGGTISGAPISGPGGEVSGPDFGGGPADTPAVVSPPKPSKPEKVAEKKEGVKRKARKRSLLGEEDTTVYRRSILGS